MGKIQKLPESLIRLIAAGEVIERPASVLKELVENSLDAGAAQITVDLWGAGSTRLRVSDNGEGMTREDAELALDRHATSKLRAFDDLQHLETFGFRGEALPSIAAVSRLDLFTRRTEAEHGWHLKVEGGKLLSTEAAGLPAGTTLDVQDLFFNTPARSKFLKRQTTERFHALRTLQELALAHPKVGFQVTAEGKGAMALSASSDLKRRLLDLWGPALTENLVPLEFSQGPLAVKGFINAIPSHHGARTYQYLYVNNRPIQQRLLTHAIYEAYHEWLPVGRHPVFVLFLNVDPAQVDVNVHPTKREVRFSNERTLYDLLFSKIREVFKKEMRQGTSYVSSSPAGYMLSSPAGFSGGTMDAVLVADAVTVQAPLITQPEPIQPFVASNLRIIGQFQKVYVLVEQGDELLLFDQHAAAERVLYEKLLDQAKGPRAATQPLLTPYVWELPPDQAEWVRDAQPALEKLGFGIRPFGANAFAVQEWPAAFPELRHAKRFLDVFIDSIQAESHDPQEHALHESVARAACRAAIKANDPLAPAEIQHLLQKLAACERPMTCPHGRPTHIRLTLAELHRRFRRT